MTRELDLPLVVYRGWQLGPDEDAEQWLHGLYRKHAIWSRGDTTAACDGCCANPPGERCGCGLHGYCVMPHIWAQNWQTHRALHEEKSAFFYMPQVVFGAALLWGHMQVGMQTGTVRAEHGCVIALLNMGYAAREAAKFYDVPIMSDDKVLQSYAREHGQEIPIPKAPA